MTARQFTTIVAKSERNIQARQKELDEFKKARPVAVFSRGRYVEVRAHGGVQIFDGRIVNLSESEAIKLRKFLNEVYPDEGEGE